MNLVNLKSCVGLFYFFFISFVLPLFSFLVTFFVYLSCLRFFPDGVREGGAGFQIFNYR